VGIRKDLDTGKEGEDRLSKILSKFYDVQSNDAKSRKEKSYHDLTCSKESMSFTIEVKNDIYAKKSGNIAIEYWNCKSNIPSGITGTKANIWCHITHNGVFVCSVKKLKEYLETTKPFRTIEVGGNQNASLFLYKEDIIMPAVFINLEKVKTKDMERTIKGLLND
jgi:hypothetical protein